MNRWFHAILIDCELVNQEPRHTISASIHYDHSHTMLAAYYRKRTFVSLQR